MSKIIAVTGATGSQGGGVVNIMKKTPGWKIRAITRNPDSESSKKLAAEGVEIVQASFDDEESLVRAFEVCRHVLLLRDRKSHHHISLQCSLFEECACCFCSNKLVGVFVFWQRSG